MGRWSSRRPDTWNTAYAAVAGEQFRHEQFFLENLRFDSPLIFPDKSRHPPDVRLEIVSGEGDYRICSRPADAPAEAAWARHSSGRINTTHDRFRQIDRLARQKSARAVSTTPTRSPSKRSTTPAGRRVWTTGIRSKPRSSNCGTAATNCLPTCALPDELSQEAPLRYGIHPALFDACLHAVFADVHRHGDPNRAFLPYRIDRVRVYRRPTQNVWSHVRVTRNDEQYLCSDTLIFAEGGELVAEILGLTCKRLAGAGSRRADTLYEGCYEYRWAAAPRGPSLHGRVFDCAPRPSWSPLLPLPVDEVTQSGGCSPPTWRTGWRRKESQPRIVRFRAGDSFDELLADVSLDRRTVVVFLAGLSAARPLIPGGNVPPYVWKGLAECPFVPSLLQLAQTLQKREGVPRLFVVTNGAAGAASDTDLDLGQAVLHGMARVITNECANVPLTVVDLSASASRREVDSLAEELLHGRRDRDESEIALRGDERFVRQLVPVDRESAEQAASSKRPTSAAITGPT